MTKKDPNLPLGDYIPASYHFPDLGTIVEDLLRDEESEHGKIQIVMEILLNLIEAAPKNAFLLPAVVGYLEHIGILIHRPLTLTSFEFWLVHRKLPEPEELAVRGKIMGKVLPREAYSALFPIGQNRTYDHTHFIAAHLSPDVDTMVASFWGFADAFAARLANGLHRWNLPGGAPESFLTALFKETFGPSVFTCLARSDFSLTLSAEDLLTDEAVIRLQGDESIHKLDTTTPFRAILLVDRDGYFLNDWHKNDAEAVQQVAMLVKSLTRWFENHIHTTLFALFAKEDLSHNEIAAFIEQLSQKRIADADPLREFSETQKTIIDDFLSKVVPLKEGKNDTLINLLLTLSTQSSGLEEALSDLITIDLTNRSELFSRLKTVCDKINATIFSAHGFLDRLDIACAIKEKVLHLPRETIELNTSVDVMRAKIHASDFLTVIDKNYPVGVVRKHDLERSLLGTVSFRDFCNFDEVKMAPYLSVISVIDHHKTHLTTPAPPLAIIGDAESCNVIVAEEAMHINDKFSLIGHGETPDNPSESLMERIVHRRYAKKNAGKYAIAPHREYLEYLYCLLAILDDTDLLSKVTPRDVICITELLNRMKSLQLNRDVEIINIDDLKDKPDFAKQAAERLLKNDEMQSIYRKNFLWKAKDADHDLALSIAGEPSHLFSDAKIQNGHARVSQTKLFDENIVHYRDNDQLIQQRWVDEVQTFHQNREEVDLFIHMMSTLQSLNGPTVSHQDELWFWIPDTDAARARLSRFLIEFSSCPALAGRSLELACQDRDAKALFLTHLPTLKIETAAITGDRPLFAILRFPAGALNSRKAMISPYLP